MAAAVAADARDLGFGDLSLRAARAFLLEGPLDADDTTRIAQRLLVDPIVECFRVGTPGELGTSHPDGSFDRLIHVRYKVGVMDPVAESTHHAIRELGWEIDGVATLRKYWVSALEEEAVERLVKKLLANDSIEQVDIGPLSIDHLRHDRGYSFALRRVPLRDKSDEELMVLSRQQQLYLSLAEMQTIQRFFAELGREPTDVELETIAQTWSEHCSHKTLAGRIAYRDEHGSRRFDNMLKETIFAATREIRRRLGDDDWCVSVFKDNAGVVQFDDQYHVAFKVETHNHPSALEPYGGANTGLGGVIRDTLGTGLGAKPICNTDVFCFAPPETPSDAIPPGVLHPRRVMKGVVAGVRDYGNRMGIPTVNGAICFDERYLGNPLVYCGNVGLLPRGAEHKEPQPGDLIVTLGGRTGRDGIHGATFSSAELTSESEEISGGAVQIGNAIMEKMLQDVLLQARDEGLYHAVTDCGAGGYSSAVGEMGEQIGARVQLDRVPLKYAGLSYTEIWISEAQERMVLAVPPQSWERLERLCSDEGVEATVIGEFVPTGRLELRYQEHQVADLPMGFLHDGRPPVVRSAEYTPPSRTPFSPGDPLDADRTLLAILSSLNVCSKEWVIRQYDHEVQAGSVIKPLVGKENDGPGDAAVVRPRLDSYRALAIACGINPRFGDIDPYHMAASAIDEAIRNCVAVGADPDRIAILDNFCWGDTERPEVLGSLVRAAIGCHDTAVAFGTPFISGKDSLNNEFRYEASDGTTRSISIPPTLLISALGQVEDARQCVTMDLKTPGNPLYLLGVTRDEPAGSHLSLVWNATGGDLPRVDAEAALALYRTLHQAIRRGWVRACHDLSEGGLAVAAAEMALAGSCGLELELESVVHEVDTGDARLHTALLLFSESNSRLLCEVVDHERSSFEELFRNLPCSRVGTVTGDDRLIVRAGEGSPAVIDIEVPKLKEAWQSTLRWN